MIRCRPDDLAVSRFVGGVAAADAPWGALSEHKMRALAGSVPADLAAWCTEGEIVAVAVAADHTTAEGDHRLAVEAALAAEARAPWAERELVEAVAGWLGDREHTFWAWRPGQIEALEAARYHQIRAIVRMERALPLGGEEPPPGVTFERFRPEADGAALVDLNNAAFAGHPENDNFTLEELQARMSLPWFDAAGVVVARQGSRLVGFCWTKVDAALSADEVVGEIYIVAVAPEAQGTGIGRALVVEGLRDLHERRGSRVGMLWVEATNTPARDLYRSLGFCDVLVNTEFARS